MDNVMYSRQVHNKAESMEGRNVTLYVTEESNGYAVWLCDHTHHLIAYLAPIGTHKRNEAIEMGVRYARRPVAEILRDALVQVYP
jgi:hypothetical protein